MSFATSPLETATPSADRYPTDERLVKTPVIRFSEIISAMSVALDITQGHPQGHCMRSCLIGMRLAETLGLAHADRSALFYALLLKDLGCSSNAAKISYLFGNDDLSVKRATRLFDWTNPGQCLVHCWKSSAPNGSPVERLLKMAAIVRAGAEGGRKISEIRCERGASIARMLQLPEETSQAIYDLDEHWNGGGNPRGVKGEDISLLGRICCLAQTVEVYLSTYGLQSAYDVAKQRRGKWFDPALVDALQTFKHDAEFWNRLHSDNLMAEIGRCEPEDKLRLADDEALDQIAEAFASVVDAKSPWTYQHSTRVADIAVGISREFGCSAELQQDIRRAGLLHDIGKLGVSNLILDKPGKPTDEEFAQIKKHAEYSYQILHRVKAFHDLADVAGAHHERLDGRGYHRGIAGSEIHFVARILTVADICEALTAKRPYRDALQWEQVRSILSKDVGTGVDQECFEALERWYDTHDFESRVESQLAAVERLVSEL